MSIPSLVVFSAGLLVAVVARPEVKCPVPVSPLNGQLFATASGSTVKYTCNPGYELKGAQIAICKGDEWFPEAPTCEPLASEKQSADIMQTATTTQRPLFKWDDESSENDTMQKDTSSGVVYVRRPLSSAWPYYYRAPLHVVDENGQTNDEALRHYYYWASQYPRSALVDYRTGHQLSESQWAWINSLHPEVRDQYLKDIYGLRADEVSYLTYPSDYYYTRQPVAVVAESPSVAALDYSCHRTERDGRIISIKAPRLANAYVHRYDRRQNRHHPYNDYLAAEYRCKAGYRLLDPRHSEMYCSQSSWVGNLPVCV